jgi:hypothetical protein
VRLEHLARRDPVAALDLGDRVVGQQRALRRQQRAQQGGVGGRVVELTRAPSRSSA